MIISSRLIAVVLLLCAVFGSCKVRKQAKKTSDLKAFDRQQALFVSPVSEKTLLIDSVVKKLNPHEGLKVIAYGVFHGHLIAKLLRKETTVLGLVWPLGDLPNPELRFPQPWPENFPGNMSFLNWQAGKIPNVQFDLLIIQGRADELSPAFPLLAAQNCSERGGILLVNYQNLPQIGEVYCQGNMLTKPFLESLETVGFRQRWEIKAPGIHYQYWNKALRE